MSCDCKGKCGEERPTISAAVARKIAQFDPDALLLIGTLLAILVILAAVALAGGE